MSTPTISLRDLPAIGQPCHGGTFAGLTTLDDGTHCAVILLPERESLLTWAEANSFAQQAGGDLPTRAIAAVLFFNARRLLPTTKWHWTCEPDGAGSYWLCHFFDGFHNHNRQRARAAAVAVRCIPLTHEALRA